MCVFVRSETFENQIFLGLQKASATLEIQTRFENVSSWSEKYNECLNVV